MKSFSLTFLLSEIRKMHLKKWDGKIFSYYQLKKCTNYAPDIFTFDNGLSKGRQGMFDGLR